MLLKSSDDCLKETKNSSLNQSSDEETYNSEIDCLNNSENVCYKIIYKKSKNKLLTKTKNILQIIIYILFIIYFMNIILKN